MTTRNILILSIVFAEILFLSFSSTYEFPAIDANEMKAAVELSLWQEKETERLKALELACKNEELDLFDTLEVDDCGISDGTITITATGNGSSIAICGTGPSLLEQAKEQIIKTFHFPKEGINYYSNKEGYELQNY